MWLGGVEGALLVDSNQLHHSTGWWGGNVCAEKEAELWAVSFVSVSPTSDPYSKSVQLLWEAATRNFVSAMTGDHPGDEFTPLIASCIVNTPVLWGAGNCAYERERQKVTLEWRGSCHHLPETPARALKVSHFSRLCSLRSLQMTGDLLPEDKVSALLRTLWALFPFFLPFH